MPVPSFAIRLLCLLLLVGAAGAACAQAAQPMVGPGKVVVRTSLGGFILGYDIDPAGDEGVLSEALTRADGLHDVAVETFDQRTGAILKVMRTQLDSKNDYVTLGIFGGVALTEFEHVSDLYVDKRRYLLTDPLDANRITGRWTPPLHKADDIIFETAGSPGVATGLFMAMKNTGENFHSFLFTSQVGANTFGPVIEIDDDLYGWNLSPALAYDPGADQAVLGGSRGCYLCPINIAQVRLGTGKLTQFRGLGTGTVNGIAVDPATHIVCTTSEDDFSVEFYDLVNGTRRIVTLPGAVSQQQSGGAVAVDAMHGLFLVGQEFSSTAPSGSSIHVFDEQGNLVESLNGFQLPASPAYMALHPSKRRGFVIVTPELTTLQSFTY